MKELKQVIDQEEVRGDFKFFLGRMFFRLPMRSGQISGVIGPNGIGKTTLIQYLKLHQKELFPGMTVGFLDQRALAPLNNLTGCDLFAMLKDFCHDRFDASMSGISELAAYLEGKLDRQISSLSGGENQLLKLMGIFCLDADIYFLDEPFNHLDGGKEMIVKNIIEKLARNGKQIFLIEHRFSIIQEICTAVGILEKDDAGQETVVRLEKYIDRNNREFQDIRGLLTQKEE